MALRGTVQIRRIFQAPVHSGGAVFRLRSDVSHDQYFAEGQPAVFAEPVVSRGSLPLGELCVRLEPSRRNHFQHGFRGDHRDRADSGYRRDRGVLLRALQNAGVEVSVRGVHHSHDVSECGEHGADVQAHHFARALQYAFRADHSGHRGGQAFNIFVLRNFIEDIPQDLFDAIEIDGGNMFYQIWHVVVPLSMPIIGTLGILSIIGQWNNFVSPLLYLRDTNLRPSLYRCSTWRANIRRTGGSSWRATRSRRFRWWSSSSSA